MHLYLRPLTSVVTTREAFHYEVRERDQSQPDLARALYERLVTSDSLDLLMGPYATGAISLGDGRDPALQQGVGAPHLRHPVAGQVRATIGASSM